MSYRISSEIAEAIADLLGIDLTRCICLDLHLPVNEPAIATITRSVTEMPDLQIAQRFKVVALGAAEPFEAEKN